MSLGNKDLHGLRRGAFHDAACNSKNMLLRNIAVSAALSATHPREEAMQRILFSLALAVGAGTALAQSDVTLTRIDCGSNPKPVHVAERFTDTYAYSKDFGVNFTYSCYLIKHGSDYMVWDTGFAPGSNPNA